MLLTLRKRFGDMKKYFIGFIFGLIIAGTISVSAYNLLAKDVSYTPSWTKENGESITNVKDAVDELYDKANKTAVEVAHINSPGASYTMLNDGYVVGTIKNTYMQGAALIYFNEYVESNVYGVGAWNREDVYPVSLYVPKTTTIKTRENYGVYNLTIYEWK
jgi:hypothetical protein